MSVVDFKSDLAAKADRINSVLIELLDRQMGIQPGLEDAMRYTLNAPGKRIRAAMVLWSCETVAGKVVSAAEIAAAAVEMVHTYSLVHDDLPAMDDDDLRRGRPTCHKAFDEATAILTGDALLTMAFEILARDIPDPMVAVRLIRMLAEVAGASGMIAGQMADMQGQNVAGTASMLRNIHLNKTAKMFAGSAAMGAIAGSATDEQVDCLIQYGLQIGLGFQIADDILDVSGTPEELGKTPGKDHKQGKMTYPGIVGMDESRRIARQTTREALQALRFFDERADRLRELADEMLTRTR